MYTLIVPERLQLFMGLVVDDGRGRARRETLALAKAAILPTPVWVVSATPEVFRLFAASQAPSDGGRECDWPVT